MPGAALGMQPGATSSIWGPLKPKASAYLFSNSEWIVNPDLGTVSRTSDTEVCLCFQSHVF